MACSKCGYYGTGHAVSKLYAKAQNLVQCPTCKGSGMVSATDHHKNPKRSRNDPTTPPPTK